LSLQAAVQVPSADSSAANRKDAVPGPVAWSTVRHRLAGKGRSLRV